MRIKLLLMTVLCSIIGLSICPECFAAIYKYVDKDGMVYFADDLQSIPPQYRAAAKIVSGEEKVENKSLTNQQQSVQAGTKEPEVAKVVVSEKPIVETKKGNDSFGSRATVSAIVVVSALFAFVILKILDADHKKSIAIARVVIIWGVSIFLLYSHAGDVFSAISSIGGKIEKTQQQAEEKGKKAAKAVKTLDALLEQAQKASSVVPATDQDKKEEK